MARVAWLLPVGPERGWSMPVIVAEYATGPKFVPFERSVMTSGTQPRGRNETLVASLLLPGGARVRLSSSQIGRIRTCSAHSRLHLDDDVAGPLAAKAISAVSGGADWIDRRKVALIRVLVAIDLIHSAPDQSRCEILTAQTIAWSPPRNNSR